MIKLQDIKVYSKAMDRYYTDGIDVYYCDKNGYHPMTWQHDKDGYNFVMIFSYGHPMSVKQHRLVYFFHNNIVPPNGFVIDHIDRNKINNKLENLRLVSCKVNSNNVDSVKISESHSKYHYDVVDIRGQEILNNVTAGTIEKLLGLPTGLVNRYMKYNFAYKGEYIILNHDGGNYDG